MAKRHSAKLEFQVVTEILSGDKSAAQGAKAYAIHPNTARAWEKVFLKTGPEEHLEYGLSRVFAELRDLHDCAVNHRVVERLLPVWDLRIMRGMRRRKPSGICKAIREVGDEANLLARSEWIGLFQVGYAVLTKSADANRSRKARLMLVIGHTSKLICGWAIGDSGHGPLALRAWGRERRRFVV